MYVKAKVKVKAKVGDKVSQLMVKKLDKPITTTQIVIMINQPKV